MGRSPCCEKGHIKKGAWTREEDERLIQHIRAHGEGSWRSLPKAAGLLRCGKSCRLRWINYLRPDLKRGNFTDEEDELIIKLHSLLGNKWSLIAGRLPGRTDNEIKNYWNTHLRRKLMRKGIDPFTHRSIGTDKMAGSAGAEEVKEEVSNRGLQWESLKNQLEGKCLEVSLELKISLPSQNSDQLPKTETISKDAAHCFYCRLGLQSSTQCSCR